MPARRGRRIVPSWIALFAILLATFAPAATSALSASSGLPWDKLCSAANAASARADTPSTPAPAHAFEHCPYCALQADLAPPPDARLSGVGTAVAFRASPVAFTRAPRGNAAWASAQPRAPPRFV
jgi:hypothetical protein